MHLFSSCLNENNAKSRQSHTAVGSCILPADISISSFSLSFCLSTSPYLIAWLFLSMQNLFSNACIRAESTWLKSESLRTTCNRWNCCWIPQAYKNLNALCLLCLLLRQNADKTQWDHQASQDICLVLAIHINYAN